MTNKTSIIVSEPELDALRSAWNQAIGYELILPPIDIQTCVQRKLELAKLRLICLRTENNHA